MSQTLNTEKHIGYKETQLGWIPKDWEVYKLNEILSDTRLGGNYKNSGAFNGLPLIKMGNIDRGQINIDNKYFISDSEILSSEHKLRRGDILFNTRNTLQLVGKVAIWNNEYDESYFNSNLLRLNFKKQYISSKRFINYILNSYHSIKQLRGFATGTTSVAAIYDRDVKNLKVSLPSLPEQKSIANCLSTWDTAITKLTALTKAKQQHKKALAQQLLTGKKRLKGFSKEWKEKRIEDVAQEHSQKNVENKDIEVLSCTKYDGLVPSLQYFGRQVFGDDLSKYKVVPQGYFAYATNHIEEGSIGYQDFNKLGLVSPMYTVFKTDETIDDIFLFKVLKSHKLIHEYNRRMEGSIDRRGGLRWRNFRGIKLNIPSIAEQTAIAQILTTADKEITLLQQQLIQLKLQKKGVMQQLLTGKKRLKV